MSLPIHFMIDERVEEILGTFTSLLGVRIVFFSPDGEELRVGQNRPDCRYCHLLRTELDYAPVCQALDQRMQEEARMKGDMVSYVCHGGMNEAVMPVQVGGQLVGSMMIGQFRTTEVLPKPIERAWRLGHNDDRLREAFLAAPCFDSRRARDLLRLFTILVEFIASNRLIGPRESDPIDPLLDYLERHPEKCLSLSQAAGLIRRSPSSLSHLFKARTGKSFRQYQIDLKLDLADRLIANESSLTVAEVAVRAGFQDVFYFSRIYRQRRGYPPVVALRKQAAKASIQAR